MRRRWQWWVSLWDQYEHPRVLALLRILVAVVILWDFACIGALGVVEPLFAPEEAGGLSNVTAWKKVPLVYQWFPPTAGTAWAMYLTVVGAAVALGAGVFSRTAALVLLFAYAQTALVIPAGDRGIDMLLRNVLLLFVFANPGAAWSFDAWWRTGRFRGDGALIPAWPRYLLILQLVVMYFTAGIAKLSMPWLPMGGYSALYMLLQDDAVARMDFGWLQPIYPLTQLATAITINWEYSTPLLLLFYWYRATPDRPGRLRAWTIRWKLHWWWIATGVVFHTLIFATLELGIFPFAMLALYPCFFHPDELGALWDRLRRRPSPATA